MVAQAKEQDTDSDHRLQVSRTLCHRDVEATRAWSLFSLLTGCHVSV